MRNKYDQGFYVLFFVLVWDLKKQKVKKGRLDEASVAKRWE